MKDNFFKGLFESFISRTVVTILGIIGTIVTLYAFLENKEVDLRYEIIANTNVLDFNADISKLEVTYDSTNLKQNKDNLRIFTVKIINNGNKDILKEFYDENEPVGIKISTGKIIETPELIQTSSTYLKRNVKLKDYSTNKVSFSRVILESGEFFIIKLLVLHKKDKIPTIISYGKIAGQKNIQVVNSIDVKDEVSFWSKTFQGDIWIQILRLISYFLVVVIIIVAVIIISEQIDNRKEKRRKNKLIKEFQSLKTYQYTRMDDAIFDRYRINSGASLVQMQNLLKSEKELNEIYKKLSEGLKSKEYRLSRTINGQRLNTNNWSVIKEMTNDGIIFKDQNSLSINLAMKDTIDKFISFLRDNQEFKNSRNNYTLTKQNRLVSVNTEHLE